MIKREISKSEFEKWNCGDVKNLVREYNKIERVNWETQ